MREPWKEMLPVKLLEHEMLEAGQRLSHAITKLDKVKARKAHYSKLIKERIDRVDAEVHSLNDTLRTGEEAREVMCREEVDLFEKKIRLIRTDTYAVYKERDMEPFELQQEIRFAGQSADNMANLDAAIDREEGEGAQNIFPFAAPAPSTSDVRAASEASGQTEEQVAAETPEEAEALREARLAAEADEREQTQDPAPSEEESPEARRLRIAAVATEGRMDIPSGDDEGTAF
jgi:hypothetical protein